MNRKWLPLILIILLAGAILLIKSFSARKETSNETNKDPASINRDRGFDRRVSFIKYSKHAECRMDCRQISQEEVRQIMQEGKINYNKSDLKNARCPRYALEGRTVDNQRVRIIFAQCNESTTVVTVIDLETEFECHCPGDDDKQKNR